MARLPAGALPCPARDRLTALEQRCPRGLPGLSEAASSFWIIDWRLNPFRIGRRIMEWKSYFSFLLSGFSSVRSRLVSLPSPDPLPEPAVNRAGPAVLAASRALLASLLRGLVLGKPLTDSELWFPALSDGTIIGAAHLFQGPWEKATERRAEEILRGGDGGPTWSCPGSNPHSFGWHLSSLSNSYRKQGQGELRGSWQAHSSSWKVGERLGRQVLLSGAGWGRGMLWM